MVETIEIMMTICSAIVSVGISYGIMSQKIKHIEQQLSTLKKDHDLLVELNTKMDLLLSKKVK